MAMANYWAPIQATAGESSQQFGHVIGVRCFIVLWLRCPRWSGQEASAALPLGACLAIRGKPVAPKRLHHSNIVMLRSDRTQAQAQTQNSICCTGARYLPLGYLHLPAWSLAEAAVSEHPVGTSDVLEADRPEARRPLPRWLSTGDMSFMAATTNAVTTAANVNHQLNTAVLELQHSVDTVQAVIDDASAAALTDKKIDVATVCTRPSSQHALVGLPV